MAHTLRNTPTWHQERIENANRRMPHGLRIVLDQQYAQTHCATCGDRLRGAERILCTVCQQEAQ